MKTTLLVAPFLLAMALAVYVQGGDSIGFALWNALPMLAGLGMLLVGHRSRRAMPWGRLAFAVVATLFMVWFHLSWLFDWGGARTSSSTSALAFIFMPLWAFILGAVASVLAWTTHRLARLRATP
ncbi:hypothetical protein [Rhodanobacter ginsenosidimutans]|uniref:Transmembrane protein n=1 Tax=Rhodanobacter ginsenosidimutans TaxID=490571 RepID=A0ABW0JZF0_9GAMM